MEIVEWNNSSMHITVRFGPGDHVYWKTYHKPQKNWKSGEVLKRLGKVLHEVSWQNGTIKRHANQLRECLVRNGEDTSENTLESLPETIILDEFAESGRSKQAISRSDEKTNSRANLNEANTGERYQITGCDDIAIRRSTRA
ncbi:unnamed protein product [Gongylonema pulchrum]|uniref:DUF4283 domain-containing protein n=1 Tax=Gongylonema pulchrum TaxID=637853 RepID=A0A183D1I6_9BILA|nr:unnamed protein product [Gongylonema pulchrum]